MKVVQKKKKDGIVTLEATATKEEVGKALDQSLYAFANQMGLRPSPNKTVQTAIKEKLGVDDPDSMVINQAMQYLAPFALDKMDISPCFPPEPVMKSKLVRDHPFQFELEVTLKPLYELTSYEPLELTLQPYKTDPSEVDRQIEQLADTYPTYVDADPHPVEKGDTCKLKLECREDGKIIDALTADSRTYTTGAGLMPDGFDEAIIGMDVGETKEFTFEGPSIDENGNETTETVECKATVLGIQKQIKPTIDDEWVSKNMPLYKDLNGLRDMIGKSLERQHTMEYEDYKRNMAAAKNAERFQGRIPDGAYESMSKNLVENIQQQIATQDGMTFDKFVEENGGQQQFQMMLMMQTRQMLTQGFALDAVFRHEHLATSNEDINDACVAINPQYPYRVRQQMQETGNGFALREAAERICAAKYLLKHAHITYEGAGATASAAKADDKTAEEEAK